MKRFVLFLLSTMFSLSVLASSYMLMPIDSVYDGDTIKTHFSESRLPPPLNTVSIRIRGIDTPELGWRAKCEKEAALAEAAKAFLVNLVSDKSTMKIENFEWDKYGGRIVSDVKVNGIDIATSLIDNGYAIQYNGGTKTKNWCE